MSKERKAAVIIDADVKPFERGLRDAEGLMKGFEQKAAKSGSGHGYRGRDKSVGGVFSGAGGGGAAGTARAFFGGWMAAEAMEGAINSLTSGIRKHQYAQAKATGDLDKMALASIKVNQAQEQLASSFPVLGASIARLMRAMGSTERLQESMGVRAGQRTVISNQQTQISSLRDEIEVLEASLAGVSKAQMDAIKIRQDLTKAEKESAEVISGQNEIIKKYTDTALQRDLASWQEAYRLRKNEFKFYTGKVFDPEETYSPTDRTGILHHRVRQVYDAVKKREDAVRDELDHLAKARGIIADEESKMLETRHEKELRLKSTQHEEEKRITEFIRDKEYEILQVKLNNELANQEDAWSVWFERSKLLDLEEQFLMDKMQREKASQEEQDVVFRLFRQREEALYGERERALAKEQEEEDKKRRDLQRRLNATDNATTAAYVSMSGAVTNASAEQQTAKNTMELVKETRMTNRELRRLTQAQQAAHFGKQAEGFRRERLN